ncbi:hypothetical protein [Micromonospora ureilytica]|uniref:hypothetical protein n=1 Tax=Micromonospora ureilytica TaxID=709868 RepID=UPI002E163B04|nr:hypothetical protein OHB55_08105 [Micromonospora ureilytica]
MRAWRLVVVACLVSPVLTGCGPEPSTTTASIPTTYTCCDSKDVDTIYHPGHHVAVHWIVQLGTGPAAKPAQVELAARLTGPYSSVGDLKNASMGTAQPASGEVTFEAPLVRPSGAADELPVSVISISTDALPGYYNLITSVRQGGGTLSGASVVRVAPKA